MFFHHKIITPNTFLQNLQESFQTESIKKLTEDNELKQRYEQMIRQSYDDQINRIKMRYEQVSEVFRL